MRITSLLCFSALLLAGCEANGGSSQITEQFRSVGKVDLKGAAPGPWDRVCVLGPYSSEQAAAETLGFSWPVQAKSTIGENDGVSLLLFVRGKQVLSTIEHPRNNGDFSNLSGHCYPRDQAKFIHQAQPTKGWPGLFPQQGPNNSFKPKPLRGSA